MQNVQQHWQGILKFPFLRNTVAVALWDSLVGSAALLFIIPLLAILVNPLFLLAYAVDLPAVAVPVVYQAWKRGETWRTITSLPSYFVLRTVNAIFLLRALWAEFVIRKPLLDYEKGH